MKRTILVPGLVALALAVGGATHYAMAEPGVSRGMLGMGAGRRPAGTPMGRLLQRVIGRRLILRSNMNVTDEQRESIREIVESHKAQIAEAVKPIVTRKRALADTVSAEKTDEAAIRAACEDLGRSLGDAAVLGANVRKEVLTVLTDDQRELIEGFRSEVASDVDAWLQEISSEK